MMLRADSAVRTRAEGARPAGHAGEPGVSAPGMTQADWLAGDAAGAADKVAAQLAGTYIALDAVAYYRADADGRQQCASWSASPDSAGSSGTLTPQRSLSSPLLAPASPQARLPKPDKQP